MAIKFYSYDVRSESMRYLLEKMDVKQLRHRNSSYRPKINDVLINWGSSKIPANLRDLHVINDPESVRIVIDKGLYASKIDYNAFRSIEFTTDPAVAAAWQRDRHIVVARTVINGCEGKGIQIIKTTDPIVPAPLYSKYQSKDREYRVHVVDGQAIKVQRKLRPTALGDVGSDVFMVRNTENGFRHHTRTVYPQDVVVQAINACKHFGLDFGGVDVIYKEGRRLLGEGKAYVVEINSAPGIEGSIVDAYATALTQLANKMVN